MQYLLPGTTQSSGRSLSAALRAAAAGAQAAPPCTWSSEGEHCKWGAANKGTAEQQGQLSALSSCCISRSFSSLQTLSVPIMANKTSRWNDELVEFQSDSSQVGFHSLEIKIKTNNCVGSKE